MSCFQANSAEIRAKLAKFGLAAVLAYYLFDGVIYTSFFVFAFLGYERSTGKNPAANLKALLGVRKHKYLDAHLNCMQLKGLVLAVKMRLFEVLHFNSIMKEE